ncbi:MAG: hypothetical protein D3922_14350 [Candidatus Electrothrix sp. AR1]|nr:hypothetical protein [Candidatus Electrothrix sp. AR1]
MCLPFIFRVAKRVNTQVYPYDTQHKRYFLLSGSQAPAWELLFLKLRFIYRSWSFSIQDAQAELGHQHPLHTKQRNPAPRDGVAKKPDVLHQMRYGNW